MNGVIGKYSVLYWKMVRFKVAVMLWMFLMLGAAHHDGLSRFHPAYLVAALALTAAYVSATTVNDLSDRKIDEVNHPHSPGRPLISGYASGRELAYLNVSSALAAAGLASVAGRREFLIILLALALGYAYSLRPMLLSHRTLATPVLLSAFYVAIPYWLGATIAGDGLERRDGWLLASLMLLFFARILLKDFRDARGDALFGKPTFLLRYGKTATCAASAAAVVAGDCLMLVALKPPPVIGLALELFVAGILWALHRLWKAGEETAEQSAIGLAAKTGNGLMLAVLGLLVLGWRNAPMADVTIFSLTVLSLYAAAFWVLVSRPHEVVIGYRG